jgi:DNA-binding MarR family transcriptional regulator
MEVVKKQKCKEFTQFELSKNVLHNLKHFKITQTAKLVLLYLADCYNPKKADMFPKQKTIAEKLGVSEISVTRAISELHKEGLIISERKYTNRYNFTSRILPERAIVKQNKMIEKKYQNDNKEPIKMIAHDKEQIKRTNKQTDDALLMKAIEQKKGVFNKVAYMNAIKRNGGASEIVNEMRQAEINTRYMFQATKDFIKNEQECRINAVPPTESWKNLGEILRAKK